MVPSRLDSTKEALLLNGTRLSEGYSIEVEWQGVVKTLMRFRCLQDSAQIISASSAFLKHLDIV
eukprot:snap_masked-scaffold_15-processed-gene-1.1-mRNA-1 protein AED:1.00 eAED:1.00 QI:0/-1/0/0/-1/1/1/0/63